MTRCLHWFVTGVLVGILATLAGAALVVHELQGVARERTRFYAAHTLATLRAFMGASPRS